MSLATGRALIEGPLDELLVSGGDSRLDIDPSTGLSRYGCAPHPRDALPLGSCSASSPSAGALEAVRQSLAAFKDFDEAYRQIRFEIADQLRIDSDVAQVVLAPSGSDAELIALALVADGPITNVVVGPSEVGSGTTLAAGARHFDAKLPSGSTVVVGDPVDAALAGATRVEAIMIRNRDGSMLPPFVIDQRVSQLVDREVGAGRRVLLHVVAHSKTGMHAPGLSTIEYLRARHGDRVVIAVDAAQGRVSRRGLSDILRQGYLVLFTGSKFYGGPPFSGALLVPRSFVPPPRFPAGFNDYFSRDCLPEDWVPRDHLTPEPNPGLLARWFAALGEIRAYYAAPAEARLEVLRTWEVRAPERLSASPWVRMLPIWPPLTSDESQRLLESKTTVYGFRLVVAGRPGPLNFDELKRVHVLLNQRGFHVGQPVALCPRRDDGSEPAVLRIAIGGPLITRVSVDTTIGATLQDRLNWLDGQLVTLREEIDRVAAEFQ